MPEHAAQDEAAAAGAVIHVAVVGAGVGVGAGVPYLSMGGEDFSYFANKKPGCFFFIGSSPKNREPLSTPHHCSHFDIEEDALLVGSSVFIQLIEDLLLF